jgi:cyclopropane fatty-acyl-phospholipid synthase-like methyltransferase
MKNTEVVRDPSDLEAVWSKQYEMLAQVFAAVLGEKARRIVEIGCGRGQLTIPLSKHARSLRFVLVDRFVGLNYSKNYKALVRDLRKRRLTGRAHVVCSDYMKWATTQSDDTYDAIISSEFIPEIDSSETRQFIQECHRILKPKGITIHSFLSPIPRNFRQKLLIMADSNPLWTKTPPKKWFSPRPEVIAGELRKAGFHRIRKTTVRARMIMTAGAAKRWLQTAQVKASFYEKHEKLLCETGLEVPDWVIVSGVKSYSKLH